MMPTTLLAIDPGDVQSAYALIDIKTRRPLEFGKVDNDSLLYQVIAWSTPVAPNSVPLMAIEMISSYGMPVGREVFETCVWIGRFQQVALTFASGLTAFSPVLILRREVKLHHCQSTAAKDSNITAALRDRFASGVSNYGKGTKAVPGWFYGFSADVWQAYALAVQQADVIEGYQP